MELTFKDYHMKRLFLCLVTVVMMTGCQAHTVSTDKVVTDVKVKSAHKMNVTIGPKVTGHSTATSILGFQFFKDTKFYEGVSKENHGLFTKFFDFDIIRPTKAAAAYKALQAANADMLVSPNYIVEVQDFIIGKTVYVTVHAWGANVDGFQEIKPKYVSVRY